MQNEAFKTLNHCVYRLRYHLVLVVKYRQPAITPEILSRLKVLTHERAIAWGGEVLEVNGEADHLHILLELPPTTCLSDFVNALKTGTSRRIRNEFKAVLKTKLWGGAFWSRSYCVVSCGGAPLKIVEQYIQNQKPLTEGP